MILTENSRQPQLSPKMDRSKLGEIQHQKSKIGFWFCQVPRSRIKPDGRSIPRLPGQRLLLRLDLCSIFKNAVFFTIQNLELRIFYSKGTTGRFISPFRPWGECQVMDKIIKEDFIRNNYRRPYPKMDKRAFW